MKKILLVSFICLLFGSCTSIEETNWDLIYGRWEVYQEKGFDDDNKHYKPDWENITPKYWDIQKDKFYYDGAEMVYVGEPSYGSITLRYSAIFEFAYTIKVYHVDETSMEAKVYFGGGTERTSYGYYCRLRRVK